MNGRSLPERKTIMRLPQGKKRNQTQKLGTTEQFTLDPRAFLLLDAK